MLTQNENRVIEINESIVTVKTNVKFLWIHTKKWEIQTFDLREEHLLVEPKYGAKDCIYIDTINSPQISLYDLNEKGINTIKSASEKYCEEKIDLSNPVKSRGLTFHATNKYIIVVQEGWNWFDKIIYTIYKGCRSNISTFFMPLSDVELYFEKQAWGGWRGNNVLVGSSKQIAYFSNINDDVCKLFKKAINPHSNEKVLNTKVYSASSLWWPFHTSSEHIFLTNTAVVYRKKGIFSDAKIVTIDYNDIGTLIMPYTSWYEIHSKIYIFSRGRHENSGQDFTWIENDRNFYSGDIKEIYKRLKDYATDRPFAIFGPVWWHFNTSERILVSDDRVVVKQGKDVKVFNRPVEDTEFIKHGLLGDLTMTDSYKSVNIKNIWRFKWSFLFIFDGSLKEAIKGTPVGEYTATRKDITRI